MSKELYCPECGTEYWGPVAHAKCNECDYVYTELEKKFNPTKYDLTKYKRGELNYE